MKLPLLLRSVLLLVPLVAPGADDLGLEARYWKAVNEGRDTSPMASVLEGLVFPARRSEPIEQLRQKALEQLKIVEASPPLTPVMSRAAVGEARSGADWPTLGGSATQAGATAEPGPRIGAEAWRHAVGWPWQAAPLVESNRVWIASPSLDHAMLCLDRATGRRIWAAPNRAIGVGRQTRAASSVIPLANEELAVYKESFDGWPLSYVVVSREDGRVLRRVPAAAQETAMQPPERKPRALVAHRAERDTAVLVKSLLTGRTWWRFPTGYLPAEPLLAWGHVFAAAEDGTLWALNLWGEQRIAWTYSNSAGWGAPPVEQRGMIYLGGNDGAVYAFETRTGRLRWKTMVAQPDARARRLFSSAALANGRVYLGGADGFLHALDAKTGQPLWKHDCGGWIRARPFVSGAIVTAATLDGRIIAVEDTGGQAKPLWAAQPGRFPICADLAGDAHGVLVSTSDFDLVAYGLADGKEQWRQSLIPCTREGEVKVCADSTPDIMQAPVTVGGGRVFFAGRNGFVLAADATTGRTLWRFECGGRVSAGPLTRDGRVFVAQVGGNGKFYALDAKTGHPLWSRLLGEVWASPEGDDRQLLVGNKQGVLHCLDPKSGATLWQRAFADGVYPAPALDATTVYTGSWDGHYYALDRSDGAIRWAFSPPGVPYHIGSRPDSAAPVLAGGKVIVPSLGGRMIALDQQTGERVWTWRGIPWRICNVTAATDGRTVFASVFGNAYEFPFDVSLVGLDLKTGRELWKVPGVGGLTAPVVTAGNRFIVGSLGRPFLCGYQMGKSPTDPPRLLWRLKTGGVMYESLPAVSGNLGYFLSNDGWLRAVR